tara:strand:- start:7532 stop:9643 length:2112 start_codon:yes stop_codon:yes gene_type:complete
MEKIFLCDISHTSQRITSEYVPYAIGCIKSYFHEYGKNDAEVQLFKYPGKFADEFMRQKPTMVGFSNYLWNLDLSYTFAKAIKRAAPDTLIVMGGRNYPLEAHRQEKWLKEHPAVDVYITGNGEEPFQKVADIWLETHSIENVKRTEIDGVHSYVDGKLHKTADSMGKDGYDQEPRVKDLTITPSPYLKGYLDEFLVDPQLNPLIESNRGCPFACTFCADGVATHNRIYKSNPERIEAELTYIAELYKGKYLLIADDNFGMFPEDAQFAEIIAKIQDKYDFPQHLQVCAGKNNQPNIIKCSDILKGLLRFGASIQSMDDDVLKNVKRSNISYDTLLNVSLRVSDTEASSYSEIILSLPGDSKEKHYSTINKVVDAEMNQLRLLTLIILDGSELATDDHINKFNIKTRFRAVHRSFGCYEFNGEKLPSVEIEEVCVENESLPFEDYIECRRYALTITAFYNDKIMHEVTQFVRNMGYQVSQWLHFIHGYHDKFPKKLSEIYDQFTYETINELADSKEDLERWVKDNPEVLESYINGDRGNNVLFNTQAKIHLGAMEELYEVAFKCAAEFTKVDQHENRDMLKKYLKELQRYSLLKRQNFMEVDKDYIEDFSFDFVELESNFFKKLPTEESPTTIHFYFKQWQKDYFEDTFRRQGVTIQAMGKIYSRARVKSFQREVARESEWDDVKWRAKTVTKEIYDNVIVAK